MKSIQALKSRNTSKRNNKVKSIANAIYVMELFRKNFGENMKTQSDMKELSTTSTKASIPKADTKAHSLLNILVYQEIEIITAIEFVTFVKYASLNHIQHMIIPKLMKRES